MSEGSAPGTLRVVETASDERFPELRQRLRAFNDERSPYHREARQPGHGAVPLGIFVYDAEHALVGGLSAETIWGWLRVTVVWVDERLRGQGIGRDLLLRAEAEAQRRGCTRVELRTFGFQARRFYEKLGYRLVGTLDDFPPGGAFHWLTKELAPPPRSPCGVSGTVGRLGGRPRV